MIGLTTTQLLEADIFKLLGIDGVSQEKKEELFRTMTRTVDARVITRLAQELTDKETEEFATIAEAGDSQKLLDWLKEKEIDLPKIITEEAIRYRVEMAELIKLTVGGK